MLAIVTPAHVWAIASAPFCAWFAFRAPLHIQPATQGAFTRISALCLGVALLAACAVASAASFIQALQNLIVLSALAYLAAFDLRFLAIPVWPTILFTAIGIIAAIVDGAVTERVAAAFVGWAVFRALSLAYEQARGKIGLGAGDALVAAMIGAWLSFEGLAWSIALGGALTIAWALFNQRPRETPLPFVPGLAAGVLGVLILQPFLGWG